MNKELKKRLKKIRVTVVKDMPDLDKDPYFVKKDQQAKAFIEKHGLPDFDKHK